jgi:hypothetical protein
MKSVVDTFEGKIYAPSDEINVSQAVEEANQVACYGYEYMTGWGKQVCHTNTNTSGPAFDYLEAQFKYFFCRSRFKY